MALEIVYAPQGTRRETKGKRVKSELRIAIENTLNTLKADPTAAARIAAGFAFDVSLTGVEGVNPEAAARSAGNETGFSVAGEVTENGAKLRVYVEGFAQPRKPRAPKVEQPAA